MGMGRRGSGSSFVGDGDERRSEERGAEEEEEAAEKSPFRNRERRGATHTGFDNPGMCGNFSSGAGRGPLSLPPPG